MNFVTTSERTLREFYPQVGALLRTEQRQEGKFPKTSFIVVFYYERGTAAHDGYGWSLDLAA